MNDALKAMVAGEPSADRLIEMAEHHGMDYSRHATMLDFARAVWRMGRDSALSASSGAETLSQAKRVTEPATSEKLSHAETPDAAVRQPLAEGRKMVVVNEEFDNLMEALERAARKGYLPDAIAEHWAEFEYAAIEAGITGAQE